MADESLALYAKEVALIKNELEDLEVKMELLKDRQKAATEKILAMLELMELDNFRAHGLLFYKENRSSVTTPKTPEEKQKLFDFLHEKGIFLEFASVNSQTLNSLYKSLAEEAAEKGNYDFEIPGVGKPTSFTTLKVKKG